MRGDLDELWAERRRELMREERDAQSPRSIVCSRCKVQFLTQGTPRLCPVCRAARRKQTLSAQRQRAWAQRA